MKGLQRLIIVPLSIFVFLLVLGIHLAHPEISQVTWSRIHGLVLLPSPVGSVSSAGAPWSTTKGHAMVNLGNGHIRFNVDGLVLAANPMPTAVIGTPGAVTRVKGTLVCDISAGGTVVVDTPAVPLSAQGDATFQGIVTLPDACTTKPTDMAFLIRIASVVPGGPPLVDRWIAHGAVRKP